MPSGRTRKTRMTGASPKNSEFLTRKQLVDRHITDAGWRIVFQKDFGPAKPLTTYDRCASEEYLMNLWAGLVAFYDQTK